MIHKNQPGKSVKTKRNKEINYFANVINILSCHTETAGICKTDGAFNAELPFAPVQHCTYRVFGKSVQIGKQKAER